VDSNWVLCVAVVAAVAAAAAAGGGGYVFGLAETKASGKTFMDGLN